MQSERELWNQKYNEGSHIALVSDPFLLWAERRFIEPAFSPAGKLLDVAGGMGRHAIHFARQGWNVTVIDVSKAGLRRAEQFAAEERLTLTLIEADLDQFGLSKWVGEFDLVLVFFYLQRQLFPALDRLLRPGGLLIYKTYLRTATNTSGPSHSMHLLEPGELGKAFPALDVLHYRENFSERSSAELVACRRT